jgi:hypothetical protein
VKNVFDNLSEIFGITRIYYKRSNRNSSKVMDYYYASGLPIGYPEKDEHLKKRLLKMHKKGINKK